MTRPRDPESSPRSNRLARETSPYLLQHAHNPVDWFAWGPEAFEKARSEGKPVFLSIGYAACHWCHVMERESFENDQLAAILNERFVSIKVDREERPDVDGIYMKAVQLLTGHGGWPLTAFLTPDGRPFFGGTYFPPEPRHGMPAFGDVLVAVADEYEQNPEGILGQADRIVAYLHERSEFGAPTMLSRAPLDAAATDARRTFDERHGGFGGAPKFPPSMTIRLLLRESRRSGGADLARMATATLDAMARGGIYDHLGGGFHRYATDSRWLVPHFEKMLYDNALLAGAYLEAHLATGDARYARVVREVLDYELRDMRDPGGGFWSSEDADSEGVEGKFYVWTHAEVMRLLGETRGRIFAAYHDVTPAGNWEGSAILHAPRPLADVARELAVSEKDAEAALAEGRRILLEARALRVRPGVDDKVLTSWNALLVSSLARAGAALGEPRYAAAAREAAAFIRGTMTAADGALLRSYRAGTAKGATFLEDYAFWGNALVDLYETTFDRGDLDLAVRQAETIVALFHDADAGGFFFSPSTHETLVARPKDPYDGATPSGNSAAVGLLLRLARLTGREEFRTTAEETLRLYADVMARLPRGFSELLVALGAHLAPSREIAIVGDAGSAETRALIRAVHGSYAPDAAVALLDTSRSAADQESLAASVPLLAGKTLVGKRAAVYVCENHSCLAPVTDPAALAAALASPPAPAA